MSKKIPDRWRDYDGCRWTPIKDERIIAFKTPLSERYDHTTPDDDGILESERFTPSDLILGLEEKGLHLGLVIDFTFTKRYYNAQEFRKKGIKYLKMMCPGKEIPSEKDVKMFEYEVLSFLEKETDPGKVVGVHCTHGVNRTGYLVCRYLIDCRGYNPDDAIQAFNEARGYPLERENYLEDLRKRTPGHGVDYKPEPEDVDNRRHYRSTRHDRYSERIHDDYRHRDRQHHLPPWQQRHDERWSSRRDDYYQPIRSPVDRYRGERPLRGILKTPREDYNRRVCYHNMYADSYDRDGHSYSRYDYDRNAFGSNYRREDVPRHYENRSWNRYQPYPPSYPNRQWRRDHRDR